ncbi:MAG: hypothetical protein DIU74_012510 [Pseudomonadota bacterium]|nr:MAG: hypothetical protein DIU74_11190 [Pseudomonadota bacterium]
MKFMLVIASAALLVACAEADQTATYDDRTRSYSGKADQRPWEAQPYGGDRAKWERELAQRAMHQNEYTRTR